MLMEQNFTEPINELVIKSVYALAITRFLNTAASFDKEKVPASLYKIAERINIPEWIVNIRHEAAHSPDLPSLDVLHAGVQFSLEWLRSVYWEKGLVEDQPESTFVSSYNAPEKLQKWCEVYQGVYYHKLKGILLTQDIKDLKLMQKVKDYLFGDDSSMSVDEEGSETSERLPSTINALMDQLVMALNSIFHEAVQSGCVVQELLKSFLKVSEFLPSKTALQKYISERDEADQDTTWHMRKMWIKVIKDVIQNHGALLVFMNELVDYDSGDVVKDLIASCWVRDIARGIILAQAALHVKESEGRNSRKSNYYISEEEIQAYERAKTVYQSSIWRNSVRLSLNGIPTTDDLVEKIILSPRKHTMIYLPDLMETTKRILSENKKKKIMKFVQLILNQTCYMGNDLGLNEKIYVMGKRESEEQLQTSHPGSASVWIGVPFGSLPSTD